MGAPKRGNNRQRETEEIQERTFAVLMSRRDEPMVISPPIFRMSVFEILKVTQPATAWLMGKQAGWEMV